ncbi:phage tail tip fiber protein [Marinomonas atlantica]|uniref:phage tail tip fiber protein n=1 Tax=Marinomonas atlantica TaxID=1806668 RepID=UPI000830C4B5|nr:DUF1983 domain-containing protein [Marinomonas atlantica]
MAQRLKAFPQPPRNIDRQLKIYLAAIQEMIETGEGARGDPLDTKLTFRDLVDSGIAKLKGRIGAGGLSGTDLEPGGVPDLSTPPVPFDLNIVAVFGAVTILWSDPYGAYSNHAYSEIYRAEGQNAQFDQAVLIGVSNGSTYSDYSIDEGVWYTYWIRFVSVNNVFGPWHDPAGASLQSVISVKYMLEELSGKIDESVLAQSLRGEVSKINDLAKMYTLTLDVDGYVSGFGTYNDGKTSDFAITADRFWIAAPNRKNKVKPFIIQDNSVYMDTAFIRDASIQEGKLGPISFGKIRDASGQPVTTVSGKLKAENIDVDSLQVTNANISGDIYSTNYGERVGASWIIRADGSAEFNNATIRGTLYANDIVGAVNKTTVVSQSATRWASPQSWVEIGRVSISLSDREDGYTPFFMINVEVDSRDNMSSGAGTKHTGIRCRTEIRVNGLTVRTFYSGALANGLAGGVNAVGAHNSQIKGTVEFVVFGYSHEAYVNFFSVSGMVGGLA